MSRIRPPVKSEKRATPGATSMEPQHGVVTASRACRRAGGALGVGFGDVVKNVSRAARGARVGPSARATTETRRRAQRARAQATRLASVASSVSFC